MNAYINVILHFYDFFFIFVSVPACLCLFCLLIRVWSDPVYVVTVLAGLFSHA